MATTGHTIKAFDQELDTLRGTICEMGGLAEAAIQGAMEALVRRDHQAAKEVVARDKRIDALEVEIMANQDRATGGASRLYGAGPSKDDFRAAVRAGRGPFAHGSGAKSSA